MIVIEKKRKTVFDTLEELGPEEGYRTNIDYAQRLTWGGEFIHSAPWSIADPGVRNVSHGCINVAPANALWLYQRTQVGDPVTVEATETQVKPGDGWTAWSVDFGTWLGQSAAGERSTAAGAGN
jgi:hypothetical protein